MKRRDVSIDNLPSLILLALTVCVALAALAFLSIYLIKRRTYALAARLGKPALMVMADHWCGLRHLLHRDARYSIPPFVSVVATDDAIELWGGPREAGPFATIPRDTLVKVRLGFVPSILPRSAVVLDIAGIANPIYLVVYGESRRDCLPARGRRLRRIADGLGLTARGADLR